MALLHPSFLWALTALAIPLAIHLFQLRRFKRLAFPDVRFLQEVTRQTRARKQVRHWLVLLARMLALACLVLAFAQPYRTGNGNNRPAGQRAVSLYVDDSWSMDGLNPQGRLLDQARTDAQETVMANGRTDRFQVLTNRFEGRQANLLGRDEALAAISQLDAGPWSRPLSQVMQRQREALAHSVLPARQAFLFTDLQRTITDVDQWTNESTVRTVIVPLSASNADNLSIDSVWFESPVRRTGQGEALHVRVSNRGGHPVQDVPVKLVIDGQQRAMTAMTLGPGSAVDSVLRFHNDLPGLHRGLVSMEDRPITFDNAWHIAWRTADRLRVLLLDAGAPGDDDVRAVFGVDSLHRFTEQNWRQPDLALLAQQDLVVLNGLPEVPSGLAAALQEMVRAGGSLAVFPPTGADAGSYRKALALFGLGLGATDTATMKVERIDLAAPFYREVFSTMPANPDLPQARYRYRLSLPPTAEVLMRLRDGSPFLAVVPLGKGRAYWCASPLAAEGGNFTDHALFPTSLLRMAELARPGGPLSHAIGEEAAMPLQGIDLPGDAVPHLLGPEGMDLIPELRRTPMGTSLVLHDADLRPGVYALALGQDTLDLIALNAPRQEGDLDAFTADELREALAKKGLGTIRVMEPTAGSMTASLKEMEQGTKLWIPFIVAALLFFVLETVLIRTER